MLWVKGSPQKGRPEPMLRGCPSEERLPYASTLRIDGEKRKRGYFHVTPEPSKLELHLCFNPLFGKTHPQAQQTHWLFPPLQCLRQKPLEDVEFRLGA
jgi:hypothetical protein